VASVCAELDGTPKLTSGQAGAAAAFTVDLLIYPLDTLKTRIQSQDFAKTYASASQAMTQAAQKSSQRQLYRGLYQGIGSVIIATLPAGKSSRVLPHTSMTYLWYVILHDRAPLTGTKPASSSPSTKIPS
jgi:hypothetical protein